jgi:hypothetical protein
VTFGLTRLKHYWFHVQIDQSTAGEPIPVCYCPSAREKGKCVHQRYLMEEGPLNNLIPKGLRVFLLDVIFSFLYQGPIEPVSLFWRDVVEDGWTNLFSVCIDGPPSVAKNRVVVTYVGPDTGFGNWRCSRDGMTGCGHITKCQLYLGQLLTANNGTNDYSMAITGDMT